MTDTPTRHNRMDAVLRMVDKDGSGALGLLELVQDISEFLVVRPGLSSEARNVKDDVIDLKARAALKDEVLPEERVFHTTYTLVRRTQRMVIGDDGFLRPHDVWGSAIEEATLFASTLYALPRATHIPPAALTVLGLEAAFPKRRKYPVFREKW